MLVFLFVVVYLSVCLDVIVAVLGVVGDYSKFGLLSSILVGVNNRVFTKLLNIIQITRNFRKILRHRF